MKIEDYSFGHIVIDGKEYASDVLIFPDSRIDASWWRDEGHVLKTEDISDLIEAEPELIIAGTGASGVMRADSGIESDLSEKGIEFRAMPTAEAVSLYNDISREKKTAACLHLTC